MLYQRPHAFQGPLSVSIFLAYPTVPILLQSSGSPLYLFQCAEERVDEKFKARNKIYSY